MPHTGVSLDRTRDRTCSHPLSARRSIRPTAWPAAFAAAPTEARPWSMKLASTLGRFLKLSKPGRAMPGKTSVTRIGDRLSTSSLEDRLGGARLGVPGERGGGRARASSLRSVRGENGAERWLRGPYGFLFRPQRAGTHVRSARAATWASPSRFEWR